MSPNIHCSYSGRTVKYSQVPFKIYEQLETCFYALKILLTPTHTHTHTHMLTQYITDTQSHAQRSQIMSSLLQLFWDSVFIVLPTTASMNACFS